VAAGTSPRALVSTFDPAREADRWADGATGATVAVFGGAGAAAAAALDRAGAVLTFWVEPRLEVWQSLMTWEDWTGRAARTAWVPVWAPASAWEALVKDRYHPLWDGAFRTLDWRAATQGSEGLWEDYRRGAARALDELAGDLSTQARFGERWYRNLLANLRRLEPGAVNPCPGARVVVAGAGPGLDDALGDPENRRWLDGRRASGDRLFSTDTALPALTARGVVPDLVLCLDGQLPTYHHFVPPRPAGVPLVADLASLPLLGRVGMPVTRYLSGHPLGAVVHRFFPEIPVLDGSLANVSGLARTTALALGARKVDAWGADFSYRDGQAYAHGTYVYALADRRATRLAPMETLLGASCYGARGRERTRDREGRALDTTPLLRSYRDLWDRYPGKAVPVRLSHRGEDGRWQAFADDWRHRLRTLPLPPAGRPLHPFVRALPVDRRQDWVALWPLALALHRRGLDVTADPSLVPARALSFLQD
jgi:hypothetical protein